MAFASTYDKLMALRVVPKARHRDGRTKRATTRVGRVEERAERDRESEDQILSVALSQPHRRNLPKTRKNDEGRRVEVHPRDALAGFVLGRMFLHGVISRDQLAAGQRYVELALRHGQHITGQMPRFPSQAIDDVAKGIACNADMTDEEAYALRRSWAEAQRALADTNEWHECGSALTAVCVMDREPRDDMQIGTLRVALNALHRVWA